MASLALVSTRHLYLNPSPIRLSALLAPLIVPFSSLWHQLFPPIVLAVPKSRTTHSAKRMRSAHKGLKDKHNIVHCQACGAPKLAHHLCTNCYDSLRLMWSRNRTKRPEEKDSSS